MPREHNHPDRRQDFYDYNKSFKVDVTASLPTCTLCTWSPEPFNTGNWQIKFVNRLCEEHGGLLR